MKKIQKKHLHPKKNNVSSSNSKLNESKLDLNLYCHVCFRKFSSQRRVSLKLTCKDCNVNVHLGCYGISTFFETIKDEEENFLEKNYFKCDVCLDENKLKNLECSICGNGNDYCKAYKRVSNNNFIHVLCGIHSINWEVFNWEFLKFKQIKNENKERNIYNTCSICEKNTEEIVNCSCCDKKAHLICMIIDFLIICDVDEWTRNFNLNQNLQIYLKNFKKFIEKNVEKDIINDFYNEILGSFENNEIVEQPIKYWRNNGKDNILYSIFCPSPNCFLPICCFSKKIENNDTVQCDICETWYHNVCINLEIIDKEISFVCNSCNLIDSILSQIDCLIPFDENSQTKLNYLENLFILLTNNSFKNANLPLNDMIILMYFGEKLINFIDNKQKILKLASILPFEVSNQVFNKIKVGILDNICNSNGVNLKKLEIIKNQCKKWSFLEENKDLYDLERKIDLQILCQGLSPSNPIEISKLKEILSSKFSDQNFKEKPYLIKLLSEFEVFLNEFLHKIEEKCKKLIFSIEKLAHLSFQPACFELNFNLLRTEINNFMDLLYLPEEILQLKSKIISFSIFSIKLNTCISFLEQEINTLKQLILPSKVDQIELFQLNYMINIPAIRFSFEKYLQYKMFEAKKLFFMKIDKEYSLKNIIFQEKYNSLRKDVISFLIEQISIEKIPDIKLYYKKNDDNHDKNHKNKKNTNEIFSQISLIETLNLNNLSGFFQESKNLGLEIESNQWNIRLKEAISLNNEIEYLFKQKEHDSNLLEIEYTIGEILEKFEKINVFLPIFHNFSYLKTPNYELYIIELERILKGERISKDQLEKMILFKKNFHIIITKTGVIYNLLEELEKIDKFIKTAFFLSIKNNELEYEKLSEFEVFNIIISNFSYIINDEIMSNKVDIFQDSIPNNYMEYFTDLIKDFQIKYWEKLVDLWNIPHKIYHLEIIFRLKKQAIYLEKYLNPQKLNFFKQKIQEIDNFEQQIKNFLPKQNLSNEISIMNFEKNLQNLQIKYSNLKIFDRNLEKTLLNYNNSCIASYKALRLLELSNKNSIKLDLNALFILDNFGKNYQETKYFNVFEKIHNLTDEYKNLIFKTEEIKLKFNEKKEKLVKFKYSQIKTFGNNFVNMENIFFSADFYSNFANSTAAYDQTVILLQSMDKMSFDLKIYKQSLRKYKHNSELFGKSVELFNKKPLENTLEKLTNLSLLKNDLIHKEILNGNYINILECFDWLFHAKCLLKGLLSFKNIGFSKEIWENSQKIAILMIKNFNDYGLWQLLYNYGIKNKEKLAIYLGPEISILQDLQFSIEVFQRIMSEIKALKEKEDYLKSKLGFFEQKTSFSYRVLLKTPESIEKMILELISTQIYNAEIYQYLFNLRENIIKLNNDIDNYKAIIFDSFENKTFLEKNNIFKDEYNFFLPTLFLKIFNLPVYLQNSEKLIFLCEESRILISQLIQEFRQTNRKNRKIYEKFEKIKGNFDFLIEFQELKKIYEDNKKRSSIKREPDLQIKEEPFLENSEKIDIESCELHLNEIFKEIKNLIL